MIQSSIIPPQSFLQILTANQPQPAQKVQSGQRSWVPYLVGGLAIGVAIGCGYYIYMQQQKKKE